MKQKILAVVISNFIFFAGFTQGGSIELPKNRFFIGGSFGGGLGNGGFNDGISYSVLANPEFGYTIAKPVDIGIILNLFYSNNNFNSNNGRVRQSNFNYGIGTFARLHVASSFFIQAQAEQNFSNFRLSFPNSPGEPPFKTNLKSFNILGGIGYGSRAIGEGGFYTLVLLDLNKQPNSPYLFNSDFINGQFVNGQVFPVIRAGFIHYFKKKDRSNNNSRVREF